MNSDFFLDYNPPFIYRTPRFHPPLEKKTHKHRDIYPPYRRNLWKPF